MTNTRITDAQFQAAQDKIDAITRKTRRGQVGTQAEAEAYVRMVTDWEKANNLPQTKKAERDIRDAFLLAVAITYGLIELESDSAAPGGL